VIWFAATWSIWYFVPIVRTPKVWGVPLIPWLPAASIGTNIFFMGSIDRDSFWRFGAFIALIIVYYALVGLHASYDAALELPVGSSPEVQATTDMKLEAEVRIPKADIQVSDADVAEHSPKSSFESLDTSAIAVETNKTKSLTTPRRIIIV